jgi:hypothetical protein
MVTSPLKPKLDFTIFNHSAHTSIKAQPITITNIKGQCCLWKYIIAVYTDNHMKTTNTLCRQNTELLILKEGDTWLPLGL